MKLIPTPLQGLTILEPRIFSDDRGWFYESWNRRTMESLGISQQFVQDNHSRSTKGTLRGLHYQLHQRQDKLVRAVVGAILDVCVDVRTASPTFGKAFGVELSGENKRQLWVPKGFAHGFLVLSDIAEVIYKVTDYWSRDAERGIRWNDPSFAAVWPSLGVPVQANARDAGFPLLQDVRPADLL